MRTEFVKGADLRIEARSWTRASWAIGAVVAAATIVVGLFLSGVTGGGALTVSSGSPSWSQSLINAVQGLRDSQNAHFDSQPVRGGATSVRGSDSLGSFTLTCNEMVISSSNHFIQCTIVADSAMQSAFAGQSSIRMTEFTLDPTTLAVISSRSISPGIITGTTGTPTATS
jgi:hypothetical protein